MPDVDKSKAQKAADPGAVLDGLDPTRSVAQSTIGGVGAGGGEPGKLTGNVADMLGDQTIPISNPKQPEAGEEPQLTELTRPELIARLQETQKLYSESSKEGKRLHSENKEIKQNMKTINEKVQRFEPFINALETDAGLATHIQSYYKPGAKQPISRFDSMDLASFDMEEAITNPKSKSAEILGKAVDDRVEAKISGFAKDQQSKDDYREQKVAFLQQHPEFTAEKVDEMVQQSRNVPMDLENLYFLMHKDDILKNAATNASKSARDGMISQQRAFKDIPGSLVSVGGGETQLSPADTIFNRLSTQLNGVNLADEVTGR